MARKRRNKRAKAKQIEPSDVLSGKLHPGVEQLIELIARVNPTGSSLPPAEMKRRYEQKSALQSLLIDRHDDELAVEPSPEQEGVVALRHRYGSRGACHAVIDELAVDARAWVRRQLDIREVELESPYYLDDRKHNPKTSNEGKGVAQPPPNEVDTVDLVERGRKAIEEYDYIEAKTCLEIALQRTDGAIEAAHPLLELLVDHMGMYDEALDLPERLPTAVSAASEVRVLLALAAGRAGRISEAEQLAEDLEGSRAGDVYLVLSDKAQERGDLESAVRYLARSRELGADPTEALMREKSIANRQSVLHEHEENEIAALLGNDEVEEAARRGRELLASWSGSQTARRAVRMAEERRREERRQEHLSLAEAALECEDFAEGVRHLRSALEFGGDADEIEPRIAAARAKLQRRTEAEDVIRVGKLLNSEDPTAGILAYLDLGDGLRRRVRQDAALPTLTWLEEMGAQRLGSRAQPDAAGAVLALSRAKSDLENGNIDVAARLVHKHRKMLGDVKDAERILSAAREKKEEDRRAQAQEKLYRFKRTMDSGELTLAREAASLLDMRHLSEFERTEAESLMTLLRERLESQRLIDTYEERCKKGDLLAARRIAKLLFGRLADADREAWLGRAEDLRLRLRLSWHTNVIESWDASVSCSDESPMMFLQDSKTVWLTPDGKDMLYATSHGGWLFIRVIDVAGSEVKSAVALRPPEPMDEYLDLLVQDDAVAVSDGSGRLLRLDRTTWDVLAWDDTRKLLPGKETHDQVQLVPSNRFAWMTTDTMGAESTTRVLDLENWRVHRELGDLRWTKHLVLGDTPRLVSGKREGQFSLLHMDGSLDTLGRISIEGDICAASIHPDGKRIVLITLGGVGESGEYGTAAELWAREPDGSLAGPTPLPDSHQDFRQDLATSRLHNATFALVETENSGRRFMALRPEGSSFHEEYESPLPRESRLLQDSRANHAALLLRGSDGPLTVPLSLQPIRLKGTDDSEYHLPSFSVRMTFCRWTTEGVDLKPDNAQRFLRKLTPVAVKRWTEDAWRRHSGSPSDLTTNIRELNYTDKAEARRFARKSVDRHPKHAQLSMQFAHMEAEEEQWDSVNRLLGDIDTTGLSPAGRQHRNHLLGMARYFTGEVHSALDLWRSSLDDDEVHCRELGRLVELAEPLPDELGPEHFDESQPIVRRLLAMIRTADETMARGDPSEALRAIDRQLVWRVGELQSLARLSVALLEQPSRNPSERYRKAVALAMFAQEHNDSTNKSRCELPLPVGHWGENRMDELHMRVVDWLESWTE